jgi:integrase/recombinase XerC
MFLERFIQYIKYEKRYSPHTVSAYQSDLDQFFSFLNKRGPDDFSPQITDPSEITYQLDGGVDD